MAATVAVSTVVGTAAVSTSTTLFDMTVAGTGADKGATGNGSIDRAGVAEAAAVLDRTLKSTTATPALVVAVSVMTGAAAAAESATAALAELAA